MDAQIDSSSAAVLIALLPILPLMMYLRRRRYPVRKPVFLVLCSVSLVLLGIGVSLVTTQGVL